jgi:hypothetical protein
MVYGGTCICTVLMAKIIGENFASIKFGANRVKDRKS